jgi:pimeloyl-ACP methyl ester carboxylesterase
MPSFDGAGIQQLTLVDTTDGEVAGHVDGEDILLDVRRAGTGQTILLLPGAEGAGLDGPFIDALAENYRIVAPTHPGFGRSPRYDSCDNISDLAYLYLDWMHTYCSEPVVVLGLQFGGWIAAEMAIRTTVDISRLVLVDPVGIKVGGPADRDIADIHAMSRRELNARLYQDPAFGGALSDQPFEEVLEIARNEEALSIYSWEPYLHNPRLRRWLHRIDVPTLVLWGESDGIVSPDYGRDFAGHIPGARFELVPGAHRPQVEQSADVAKAVTSFLA